jgi:preprotein translocase subunit SecD
VRAAVFAFALLASVSVATAEPLTLRVLNATVTDVAIPGVPEAAGLSITLQPESTDAFAAFTAANIGKTVELKLNGKVVLTGVIGEPITNGRVRVGGNYNRQDLRQFAAGTPDGGFVMTAEVVPTP